jgi:hypothetical protein
MAKARPKVPGHRPNTPGDRRPDLREPRPSERDPVYREIGAIITREWANAMRTGQQLDRDALQRDIADKLRLAAASDPEGDPMGIVEVGIIVDPKPEPGRKFVWIVVPYPEAPAGVDANQWLQYYQRPAVQKELGEAVLFGCGR